MMIENMTPCIEWSGSKSKTGYGTRAYKGKARLAHRIAWILAFGDIPEGMCVLHKCDNPPCINLDHLYLGTYADNARDRKERNRKGDIRGSKNGGAKIQEQTAVKIKMLKGLVSSYLIAKALGISQVQVCNIMRGKSWSNVTANTRYSI